MSGVRPVYGVSSNVEINVEELSTLNPLEFITDASKAGLWVQLFVVDDVLWARIAGEVDAVLDFRAGLK